MIFAIGNESQATWDAHQRDMMLAHPQYDTADRRCVSDGDKGFTASWHSLLQNALMFRCTRHRKDNILTNAGIRERKTSAKKYLMAATASTQSKLDARKTEFNASLTLYTNKLPDYEQYAFSCGNLHRCYNQNSSESLNATMVKIRSLEPATMLRKFLIAEAKRLETSGKNARLNTAEAPPRVLADIAKKHENVTRMEYKTVTFSGAHEAEVASVSRPHITYKCSLAPTQNRRPCDCGFEGLEAFPCNHQLFAAQRHNINPVSLLLDEDTSQRWKDQYRNVGLFVIPTRAEVEGHGGGAQQDGARLYPPATVPPPKGRPRSLKRKKGVLERRQRAPKKCGKCFLPGHSAPKCPHRV